MAYTRENMRLVTEALAESRARAEALARKNEEHLHAISHEAAKIDKELSKTGLEAFRIALSGENVEERIAALRRENEALQARRAEVLASLGFSPDYTKPKYACTVCNDTGYTEKGMCSCMRRMLTEAGFRSSGLGGLIEKQSFDNFSLKESSSGLSFLLLVYRCGGRN